MPATATTARKRAVNLTLNESLVAQAKNYTSKLLSHARLGLSPS